MERQVNAPVNALFGRRLSERAFFLVRERAAQFRTGSSLRGSDATKNHPVNINYTGSVGEALTLRLNRTGGTGDGQNIAVDGVRFAQVPEPSTLALLSAGCLAGIAARARRHCSRTDRPA